MPKIKIKLNKTRPLYSLACACSVDGETIEIDKETLNWWRYMTGEYLNVQREMALAHNHAHHRSHGNEGGA